jgi:hypothetical protein
MLARQGTRNARICEAIAESCFVSRMDDMGRVSTMSIDSVDARLIRYKVVVRDPGGRIVGEVILDIEAEENPDPGRLAATKRRIEEQISSKFLSFQWVVDDNRALAWTREMAH